jgi:hypothetical protein
LLLDKGKCPSESFSLWDRYRGSAAISLPHGM